MDKSADFWDGDLEFWLYDLLAVESASLDVNFLLYKIHVKIVPTSRVGFPGGSEVKASAGNAGDVGSIPGLEDPLEK